MATSVSLLGTPTVRRDGTELDGPRGRKVWALLAYLASSEMAATREHLAGLLFAEADDPLGALRWNLAELRRLLGDPDALKGSRIALRAETATIDVRVLRSGSWQDALALPGLGHNLLEGMDFPSSPAFDAWLLNERRHLRAAAEAILREAAFAQLGAGRPQTAIDTAARLVAMDPLDEEHQALLIRSYASAGDAESAARQLAAATELFRRELGVEPDPIVVAAAQVRAGSSTAAPTMSAAGARAQLEAGQAAIDAGALEAGLECFRRAIAEAHAAGVLEVKVEALWAMGSALVHSGRRMLQEEGAAALHEALSLTERTGQSSFAAASQRELAWVEFLTARYDRAMKWLDQAEALAADDGAERARILSVAGCCLSDVGRHEEAMARFRESIALAEDHDDRKRAAFSLAFLGRSHLLRNELDQAEDVLQRSLDLVKSAAWIGFQPLAEAFLGEVRVAREKEGEEMLEHAFSLACRLGDACYESFAARALGAAARSRGALAEAMERFQDARHRLVERPDYVWLEAHVLNALCATTVEAGHPSAQDWIQELQDIASRGGMRELLARSYLHRSHLGDASALEAAKLIAREIDNPYFGALLDAEPVAAT